MQPRKILVLTANPQDTSRLRLDKEVREITTGLQRARHRKIFDLEQRWAVQPRDLRQALLEVEPEIVHFSGHGSDEGGLLLENDAGNLKLVEPHALADLFSLCKAYVRCVILNACYSESQANAIHKHINTVIGMQSEIGDNAAINFTIGFYDALGAGRTLSDAYRFGCNSINLEGISGHKTPVLLEKELEQSNPLSENWNNEAYVSLHLAQEILERSGIEKNGNLSHWYPQYKLGKSDKISVNFTKRYIVDFFIKDYLRNIEFLVEVKSANNKVDDAARFQMKNYLQYSGIRYGILIDPSKIEIYEFYNHKLSTIRIIVIKNIENLKSTANKFKEVLDLIGHENNRNSHL